MNSRKLSLSVIAVGTVLAASNLGTPGAAEPPTTTAHIPIIGNAEPHAQKATTAIAPSELVRTLQWESVFRKSSARLLDILDNHTEGVPDASESAAQVAHEILRSFPDAYGVPRKVKIFATDSGGIRLQSRNADAMISIDIEPSREVRARIWKAATGEVINLPPGFSSAYAAPLLASLDS